MEKKKRAPRRNKEKLDADKIIREGLMDLGEKVYIQTKEQSRVAKDQFYLTDRVQPKGTLRKKGGTLRDSVDYKPLTDTILLLVQVDYGKWNYPKGDNTKRTYSGTDIIITDGMNALLEAIEDNIDETTDFIVGEIMEQMTADYGSK